MPGDGIGPLPARLLLLSCCWAACAAAKSAGVRGTGVGNVFFLLRELPMMKISMKIAPEKAMR